MVYSSSSSGSHSSTQRQPLSSKQDGCSSVREDAAVAVPYAIASLTAASFYGAVSVALSSTAAAAARGVLDINSEHCQKQRLCQQQQRSHDEYEQQLREQ